MNKFEKILRVSKEIKKWIFSHKKTSVFLALILAFIVYKIAGSFGPENGQVQYITATAERGAIVSSVTGTGQVSASNRVDVTAEVSGDIVSVPAKLGDTVSQGQTLASMDSRNASRVVDNAQLSLENAKIAYEKAQKKSLDQSESSSVSDLNKAYEDGYTAVSNAMIDIPDIVAGANSIFYDPEHSPYFGDLNVRGTAGETGIDYKYEAGRTFDQAKKDYDDVFKTYKSIKASDREKLVSLMENTHAMVKKLHTALTGAYNAIDYVKQRTPSENVPAQIATDKSALSSYITKLNNHINSLSNSLTDIEDAKDSSTEATLDLKTAELNLSKAEDDLRNAREDLASHQIRAPFSGVIGKVDVKTGDRISSNGAVATIITDEKIAEVSLNEVDISKVKIGQKATLTFDAIDDLTITGTVSEVDLLGTVSQGVVNYTVKIAFDVNDERVKTGMSLSAAIVNDTKQNVIRVPNSAVKSQGNASYVETLDSKGSVAQLPVQTGLSNDEYTEIISGLNEGDSFVSRTITQSSTASTQQAPSRFGGGGQRSIQGSGGNVRFQTR